MTMRRLSLIFVLVAALAGCSSGSSNVASSTRSTSPTAANPTSAPATVAPTSAPPAADSSGGGATNFCDAFKQLQNADTTTTPAAIAAAFKAAAADMRKFAPPEIKDAAGTYADLIESIAKAAQGNTMDEAALQKALADGMAGASTDIGKVAMWVGQNCQL